MKRFEVLEVSDSRDFCECCGKTGLKRVVFIRDNETDVVKHYGTVCATSPAKGFDVEREVRQAVAKAKSYEQCLASITGAEYRKAGGRYVKTAEYSMAPADQALYQATRSAVIARGFNY